jgi:hypothetical protein
MKHLIHRLPRVATNLVFPVRLRSPSVPPAFDGCMALAPMVLQIWVLVHETGKEESLDCSWVVRWK